MLVPPPLRSEFMGMMSFAPTTLHELLDDEVECDVCVIHLSSLTDLESKYVALLDENDELKSRSGLLGACKSCLGLQFEMAEKVARISLLEKASSNSESSNLVLVN